MKLLVKIIFLQALFNTISFAQNKYALLIGINNYSLKNTTPKEYIASRKNIQNLDGCINDILAINNIIQARFGFVESNIKTLFDEQATNFKIKNELLELKNKAQDGDLIFFYYSGHGSQVRNSLSYDGTGNDQTIVPSDLYDIRNKELSKMFNDIIDKIGNRGKLTVIFDCCHSGGLSRGILNLTQPKERLVSKLEIDFKDGNEFPKIEDRGALVFSAAQRDQSAKETSDENGNAHGAFSYSLIRALSTGQLSESAESIFMRVNINLKASNRYQEPIMGANDIRKKQSLLGNINNEIVEHSILPVINAVDEDEIFLQGGFELALNVGAILKKINTKDTVLLSVSRVNGIGNCTGKLLKGNFKTIKKGDYFKIEKFSISQNVNLKINIPQADFSLDELSQKTKDYLNLCKNKYFLSVSDPSIQMPDYTISFTSNKWLLYKEGSNKILKSLENLNLEVLKKHIPKESKIFLQLPTTKEIFDQLNFELNNQSKAIEVVNDPLFADYTLIGIIEDSLKFAWFKTDFGNSHSFEITPSRTTFLYANSNTLSKSLIEQTYKISKIKTWFTIISPPQDQNSFPYKIGLKNRETEKVFTQTDKFYDKDKVSLCLVTDSSSLTNWDMKKRYCYVFIIDSKGESTLLYPNKNTGNEKFPLRNPPFLLIENLNVFFNIAPPFGIDTYFMLTTEIPISDISIFESSTILSRGNSNNDNSITSLIKNIGTKSRGINEEQNSNWSLQKLMMYSLPKAN